MREETRRRLDRVLMMQRLKWMGAAAVLAVIIGVGLWFTGLDATVQDKRVAGTVERVGPLTGTTIKNAAEGLAVDVKLEDGHLAHVFAKKTTDPHIGDHVSITEHIHGTGRVTYSWR
jgi:hypothetical protein